MYAHNVCYIKYPLSSAITQHIMTTINSAEERCVQNCIGLIIFDVSVNNSENTKNFRSATCLYLVIICFSVYYEAGIIYASQKIEHNYISV